MGFCSWIGMNGDEVSGGDCVRNLDVGLLMT